MNFLHSFFFFKHIQKSPKPKAVLKCTVLSGTRWNYSVNTQKIIGVGGFFEIAKSRIAIRMQHKVHFSGWHRHVLCQLWGHCGAFLTPHVTHSHWQDNAVTWNLITEFLIRIWRPSLMQALVNTEHILNRGGHILSQPLDTLWCSEM